MTHARPSAAASRAAVQGFHPTVCGLPGARRMTERALLGFVLEQGYGHKMILPSLLILSPRMVTPVGAEPLRPSVFQGTEQPRPD